MAKNLIDGDSFEFEEGVSKTDFDELENGVIDNRQAIAANTSMIAAHIDDMNVHLTEAEKAFLDNPWITGVYYGNGTSRSINLGFRPQWLMIFASGMPPYHLKYIDQYTMNLYVYSGFGIGYYSSGGTGFYTSPGVTITDTGFIVSDQDLPSYGLTVIHLNDSGTGYYYMASRNPRDNANA